MTLAVRRAAPRFVHPAAWWLWGAGLGAAALHTTNPLLLGLIVGVAGYVVASRRTSAPWSRSFGAFLRIGLIVIAIRMAFSILFGARIPGTTLFTLPSVPLPGWAGGVSIGGPVTAESLVLAFYQGLRLAVVLACFGAASSLASPFRLLRSLPAVLYEAGVAVTVALTFAPQAVTAAGEIREARRLRGRPTSGLAAWRGLALPVLEGALERSIALAGSMDSRGYGRRADLTPRARHVTTLLTVIGMLAVCIGMYALLDGSAPSALGLPVLASGALTLAGSLLATGRRSVRTRYRADPWALPEWVTSLSGMVVLAAMVLGARHGADIDPSVYPLVVPTLPTVVAATTMVGLVPAFATPRPPRIVAETPPEMVVPDALSAGAPA